MPTPQQKLRFASGQAVSRAASRGFGECMLSTVSERTCQRADETAPPSKPPCEFRMVRCDAPEFGPAGPNARDDLARVQRSSARGGAVLSDTLFIGGSGVFGGRGEFRMRLVIRRKAAQGLDGVIAWIWAAKTIFRPRGYRERVWRV
jgi:hypothetical protein